MRQWCLGFIKDDYMNTCENEVRGAGVIVAVIAALLVAITQTGCMQFTGAKSIDLWGAKFEANSGFDVSAGVMQYDHALDRKGMNIEQQDNRKMDKY